MYHVQYEKQHINTIHTHYTQTYLPIGQVLLHLNHSVTHTLQNICPIEHATGSTSISKHTLHVREFPTSPQTLKKINQRKPLQN